MNEQFNHLRTLVSSYPSSILVDVASKYTNAEEFLGTNNVKIIDIRRAKHNNLEIVRCYIDIVVEDKTQEDKPKPRRKSENQKGINSNGTNVRVPLSHVGWVVNDQVQHCLLCKKRFSMLTMGWKHHCRACGLLVCGSCSNNRSRLESYESLGVVRICSFCTRNNRSKVPSSVQLTDTIHDGVSLIVLNDSRSSKQTVAEETGRKTLDAIPAINLMNQKSITTTRIAFQEQKSGDNNDIEHGTEDDFYHDQENSKVDEVRAANQSKPLKMNNATNNQNTNAPSSYAAPRRGSSLKFSSFSSNKSSKLDQQSDVSSLTNDSMASSQRKQQSTNSNKARKSAWFLPLGKNKKRRSFPADGRELLRSEDMIDDSELNLSAEDAKNLVELSTKEPAALLGYQIVIYGNYSALNSNTNKSNNNNQKKSHRNSMKGTIVVITGLRKNSARQSEFRVSSLAAGVEDEWVRLQRSKKKTGAAFHPLRRALVPGEPFAQSELLQSLVLS